MFSFFSQSSSSYIQQYLYPEASVEHLKWICPVCQQRFKWDTQLSRHEEKTGHYNPERQERRKMRGKKLHKKTSFSCQFCGEDHRTNIDLLNHRQWCLNDPEHGSRARYYASSWPQSKFQCRFHDMPYYYSSLELLQRHISTHKQPKQTNEVEVVELTCQVSPPQNRRIDQDLIQSLNREFKKYRRLTADQVERIARVKRISTSSVRRYFRKYKQEIKSNMEIVANNHPGNHVECIDNPEIIADNQIISNNEGINNNEIRQIQVEF